MKQPVYDNLIFGTDKLKFTKTVRAEVKTEIKKQEVKTVLGVFALPLATENEVKVETVKVSGKVIFYLNFVDSEGRVRKFECGNEIFAVFGDKEIAENDFAHSVATVEKCGYSSNGDNIIVYAEVKINATVNGNSEMPVVVGGDGIIIDKCETTYEKRYGVNRGAYPIDEEFELPYAVEDVLSQRAVAVVSAVQCGVGSVIIDGEIYFSALMLQKSEKGDIIREDKTLPFRMEVESEDAMPSMRAISSLAVKSFKTDTVVEDNKSVVRLSVTLSYANEIYAETEIETVIDAFSSDEELEVFYCEHKYNSLQEVRLVRKTVSARAQTEELPIGARLVAIGGERVDLVSTSAIDGGVKAEGVISVTACYQDVENGPFSFAIEVPFETVLDLNCNADGFNVSVAVCKVSARTVSVSQTEVVADLVFSVYPQEVKNIKFVKDIKCVGERKRPTSALSVYIPVEGENLWSLAKRLGVCPSEVLSANPELQFPLSGKERIVIYRKLN